MLVITTETVRSHVKNMMRKLDATSRADGIANIAKLRRATNWFQPVDAGTR